MVDIQKQTSFVSFIKTDAPYLICRELPIVDLFTFAPQTLVTQIINLKQFLILIFLGQNADKRKGAQYTLKMKNIFEILWDYILFSSCYAAFCIFFFFLVILYFFFVFFLINFYEINLFQSLCFSYYFLQWFVFAFL